MNNITATISILDKPSARGLVATAAVNIAGILIKGYKLVTSKRGITVYPPAKMYRRGKFMNIINVTDPKLKERIEQAIIGAYERAKTRPKREIKRIPIIKPITCVSLKLLFHIYENHKAWLTPFRLWFIARHALDKDGKGWVDLVRLARASRVTRGYAYRICRGSWFFRGATHTRAFYRSKRSLLRKHQLVHVKSNIRGEVVNKKLLAQLRTKKLFIAYITKSFFERDLRKNPKNLTKGRIGYERAAARFKICKNTVISSLKRAVVKRWNNVRHYKQIRFTHFRELHQWIMDHYDQTFDGMRVEHNPRSFFVLRDVNGYYLARRLPHIYELTCAFLAAERRKRGTSGRKPRPSKIAHSSGRQQCA